MAEVEIKNHSVTFESKAAVGAGHALSLSLDPQRKLQVHVELCRPLENGNYLVFATAAEPIEARTSVHVAGSRSDIRVPERARVMSPRLPNYSGLSVDFSLSGVQLETAGPVEVGDRLPLEVTLPGWKADLSCLAEVVWCTPLGDSGSYRAGCRFVNPDPELYDSLQTWITARLGKSLSFRSPRPAPAPLPEPVEAEPIRPEAVSHVEVPHAIQLPNPIRPVLGHHEELKIEAVFRGYIVEHDRVKIQLDYHEAPSRVLEVQGMSSLCDTRGRAGDRVAYVATETTLEQNILRFVSPSLENLLVVETSIGTPFEGAEALAERLH